MFTAKELAFYTLDLQTRPVRKVTIHLKFLKQFIKEIQPVSWTVKKISNLFTEY